MAEPVPSQESSNLNGVHLGDTEVPAAATVVTTYLVISEGGTR